MSDEQDKQPEDEVLEVPEAAEMPEHAEGAESAPEEAPVDAPEASEVAEASEGSDGPEDTVTSGEEPPAEEAKPRMELSQLKSVIEALMFASPDPITPRMLYKLLNDEPKEDVKAALEALKADYAERGGMHIAEVAGGMQITTRPEYHEWVRRLFHERSANKLSVASLETLSVIAYKQPVTAAEIGEIRSVNTSGVLSTLLERHLIKIVGRKNVIGRPFLYGTTKEFLIRFGLNDLGDLPKIEDMAQQLGFEPPPVLMERPVPEEMLPLEEGDVPEDQPE